MGLYRHMNTMHRSHPEALVILQRERQIAWRAEPAFVRLEHPTNPSKARQLGYKAKQGVVVVRVRLGRGGKQRPSIRHGRRSRNLGQNFVMGKNYQWMAEERVNKEYVNLEVLNSYEVGKDGIHCWYEVILVDPEHPAIKADPVLSKFKLTGRVYRGLTSAGRRGRGLNNKGKGAEKVRPSMNAHKDRAK